MPRLVPRLGLLGLAICTLGCRDARIEPLPPAAYPLESAVGLDLRFVDGTSEPLPVLAGRRYFIDSIAILAQVTSAPGGLVAALEAAPSFADLDWSGLEFDQERRLETFAASIRVERSWAGAAWMRGEHRFEVRVRDGSGQVLGHPLTLASSGDWPPSDQEAFATRRLGVVAWSDVVPEDGILDDIPFTGIAAAQFRNGIRGLRTFEIPSEARLLEVVWDHRPDDPYTVSLAPVDEAPYDYGLTIVPTILPAGSDGMPFGPGDTVSIEVNLFDRSGVPLHPPGSLPSYSEVLGGSVDSGLVYDTGEPSVAFYLDTNRERGFIATLVGPLEAVVQTHREIPREEFLADDVQVFARPETDGYVALGSTRPPGPILFGSEDGYDTPLSSVFSFELPDHAPPGIYRFAVKAHRVYRGEESIAVASVDLEVQAPSPPPAPVAPLTGNCENCHHGDFSLAGMLHYTADTSNCTGCHLPYSHRTENSLPYRVHRVHARSERYQEDLRDCTVCHLDPTEEVVDLARWLVCIGCHRPQDTHDGFHPFWGDVETCADVFCHHAKNPEPHILQSDD